MAASEQQREETQRSNLNAQRYKKPSFQQKVRGELLQRQEQIINEDESIGEGQKHKYNLGLLKANSIKQANKKAGETVGKVVGGTIFSIFPGIGTFIGMFLGGMVGKKAGLIGIGIFALFSMISIFLISVAALYSACQTTTGKALNAVVWAQSFGSIDICEQLQLQ